MTAQVPLRFLPADVERLRRLAFQQSRSVGDFVRGLVLTELDRYTYGVCPRCGSGHADCTEGIPAGLGENAKEEMRCALHEKRCATYVWAAEVCDACKAEMDDEFRGGAA